MSDSLPSVVLAADDLTGAADAAAPFASCGWRVSVVLGEAPSTPRAGAAVAVDLASRTRAPDPQLLDAVADALAGADIAFVKVDSLLRGNYAQQVRALARAGRYERVLFCPALPAQRRVFVGGRVFVDGDPGAVADVAADVPIVLADAHTDDDLAAIAVGGVRTLWVGSAGLAAALARHYGTTPLAQQQCVRPPVLVFVGSRTDIACRQVRELARDLPHIEVEPGDSHGDFAIDPGADVVVSIASSGGDEDDAIVMDVARALAPAARAAGTLVLCGGDTARAVLTTLGVTRLHVVAELEPGVVRCEDDCGRVVVTKSGSFGDDRTLRRIVAALRGGA